jgi:hypothetical protein
MRSGCSEEGFRNEVFFKRDGTHGELDDAKAAGVSSMWKDDGGLEADLSQFPSSHIELPNRGEVR